MRAARELMGLVQVLEANDAALRDLRQWMDALTSSAPALQHTPVQAKAGTMRRQQVKKLPHVTINRHVRRQNK